MNPFAWFSRKHAKTAFHKAWLAHREAVLRHDTRRQHEAWPALRDAMNERLRVGS